MQLFCLLIGFISGMVLFFQDVKKREISLFILILFALSGAGYRYAGVAADFISDLFINSLIVFAILSIILAYYRLKGANKIMDHLLGWGDIAMLLALSPWFTPWQFSLFYCLSTASLSILFLLLIKSGRWKPADTIPLAGLMGLLFSLFFPLYHFFL